MCSEILFYFSYLLFLLSESYFAHSVSLHDSVVKFNRLYIACKVMDSFSLNASIFSNDLNLFRCCYTDLFKSYRKSYFKTEILYLLEFFLSCTLKNKLNECTERNAAAVICMSYSKGSNILVRPNGCSPLKARIYGLFSCFSVENF